jgi:translation initiation factor IF-3
MASPPVVRFLDFGQYKYELTKRDKEAKRKQRSVTFKEVRLTPKIGVGDFDTKVHRAIEFLEDGDRIKVTVRFRGRELTHPEIGRNLISRFVDRVKDHGVAERTPLLEGKSMHITMASLHKPKGHDAPDRKHAVDEVPADAIAIDGVDAAEPAAMAVAAAPTTDATTAAPAPVAASGTGTAANPAAQATTAAGARTTQPKTNAAPRPAPAPAETAAPVPARSSEPKPAAEPVPTGE